MILLIILICDTTIIILLKIFNIINFHVKFILIIIISHKSEFNKNLIFK